MKVAEAASERGGALPPARETSVELLEDVDDTNSGLLFVEKKRYSQATADFEAGFKHAGSSPKKAVADPKGQGNMDVPDIRNLLFVGESSQSDDLRDFMYSLQ